MAGRIARFHLAYERTSPRNPLHDVAAFLVFGQVQSTVFRFAVDPNPDRELNQLQNHDRRNDRVNCRRTGALQLSGHLRRNFDGRASSFTRDQRNSRKPIIFTRTRSH